MVRIACLLALVLAACSPVKAGPENVVPVATQSWHRLATEKDRGRLRKWRETWVKALKAARAGGYRAEVDAAGPLLDPDAAIADPAPPAGDYRCRTIKLGAKAKTNLVYIDYPAFTCRIGAVEGQGTIPFAKIDGSQRPIGRLFPETRQRLVFIGTLQLGDEQGSIRYGHDADRDMIGLVERIGPSRWRLVLPTPAFDSLLDVIQLTPQS